MNKITIIVVFSLLLLVTFQIGTIFVTVATTTSINISTSCPENVEIYFLDVGQGDSILIKTPSKNILIDGGPTGAGSTVVNYLTTYNVANIDLMVATHPHADHIGGLISVLQSTIPVQDIIYNGYNYTSTQTFNTWKTLALTHNLTQASKDQVYEISPTINFTILSPINPTQFSDLNAESIVMRLQVGNTSIMFTGDAQFDTEQFLVSSGSNLSSQILKVGHHGSSTSTSQAFLSAITPNYAVICAGIDNTYGHPTQQTLDILASNNVITYGTYAAGNIVFSLNSPSPSPTPTSNSSPTPTPTPSPTPSPSSSPSPTPSPTSNPTSNPTTKPIQTPTQKPATNPTATPQPTPRLPEFSLIIIVSFMVLFSACAIILKVRHNKQR